MMIVMSDVCIIMFSRSMIDESRSIIKDYRSIIDDSRSIIVDFRSVIDNSRVMLQLVASFTIVIYDHLNFIVQTIGERKCHQFNGRESTVNRALDGCIYPG
jgi:hypothetical protein